METGGRGSSRVSAYGSGPVLGAENIGVHKGRATGGQGERTAAGTSRGVEKSMSVSTPRQGG